MRQYCILQGHENQHIRTQGDPKNLFCTVPGRKWRSIYRTLLPSHTQILTIEQSLCQSILSISWFQNKYLVCKFGGPSHCDSGLAADLPQCFLPMRSMNGSPETTQQGKWAICYRWVVEAADAQLGDMSDKVVMGKATCCSKWLHLR